MNEFSLHSLSYQTGTQIQPKPKMLKKTPLKQPRIPTKKNPSKLFWDEFF